MGDTPKDTIVVPLIRRTASERSSYFAGMRAGVKLAEKQVKKTTKPNLQETEMARQMSIGTKQQISFTLGKDLFGDGDDLEALKLGLARLSEMAVHIESIESREDLAETIRRFALQLLSDARKAGAEALKARKAEEESERRQKLIAELAAIDGEDEEEVARKLGG